MLPCSCFVFSIAAHAALHSCSSGEGISPAEPAALSFLACHQWWSSLLIIWKSKKVKFWETFKQVVGISDEKDEWLLS